MHLRLCSIMLLLLLLPPRARDIGTNGRTAGIIHDRWMWPG